MGVVALISAFRTDVPFLAQVLGRYLDSIEVSAKFRSPGPYQKLVLLEILEHGFASAPIIRDKLSRDYDGWSTDHVGRQLRNVFSKGLVKERKIPKKHNPYRQKFYELTTAGLHSLLISGAIKNLEKVRKRYPDNEIFRLFLYPFFNENTLVRPTKKLQSILVEEYFPSLCGAVESTLKLLKQQNESRTNGNLRLIVKNVIAERVNLQLLYITFLTDRETVRVLAYDDFFKFRLKTIKTIFDQRHDEIMGTATESAASSA